MMMDELTQRAHSLGMIAETFEDQRILMALAAGMSDGGVMFTVSKGKDVVCQFSFLEKEKPDGCPGGEDGAGS